MFYAILDNVPALATSKGQRAACPGCGAEVHSKCGEVLANHWAHLGDNCGHESDEHVALKLLFAYPNGAVEVHDSRINRRADVMIGRQVWEIQRSQIAEDDAQAREADWRSIDHDVVWVVVEGRDVSVASRNVVHVRLLPDYRIEMTCRVVGMETFDPMRKGRSAAAMAVSMLARRDVLDAKAEADKARQQAELAAQAAAQATERAEFAYVEAREAAERRAIDIRAAVAARNEIDGAKRDRETAAADRRRVEALASSIGIASQNELYSASIQWIHDRTGVAQIDMVRRLARHEAASAAVVAAIDQRTHEAVTTALGDGSRSEAARRVTDTCMVWAGVGLRDRIYCVRIYSGERADFADVADALLWCVEALPIGFGAR